MICVQPSRNRKETLVPKSTDEMIEVLSVVGDITNVMTIDAESFVEVTTSSSSSDSHDSSEVRPRKRAKLDHLSTDEKAQHRKMMNRISAQSARDRQKAQMVLQEVQIKNLTTANGTLKKENESLTSKCNTLISENQRMAQLMKEYEAKIKLLESFSGEIKTQIKIEPMEDTPSECKNGRINDIDSSLEPAEGTRTGERLILPSSSVDMFSMDLDAPELIQALDDFTQQILSPGNMLSSRLEAAFSSDSSPASNEVDADIEISQVEGTRVELKQEEIEAVIDKLNAQIQPLIMMNTTPQQEAAAAADAKNEQMNNALPLNEPVFQILSEIFDDFNADNSNNSITSPQQPTEDIRYIPEEDNFLRLKHQPKKENDFNSLFESYPYDSWDSPGSVESDLFPDLAF